MSDVHLQRIIKIRTDLDAVATMLSNTDAGRVAGVTEGDNAAVALASVGKALGALDDLVSFYTTHQHGITVRVLQERRAWIHRADRLANVLTPLANLAEEVAEHYEEDRDRVAALLDQINALPPIPETIETPELFVIWVARQGLWWCPDCKGYTGNLLAAGAYTRADTERANIDPELDEVVPLAKALRRWCPPPSAGLSVAQLVVPTRDV